MFINCSNHPSDQWGEKQIAAAHEYGEIVDVPFLQVSAEAPEEMVKELAEVLIQNIRDIAKSHQDAVVMVQGEYTLTYALVKTLKDLGYRVVSACSGRNVVERKGDNGESIKESVFQFVRFREYW